MSDSCCAPHHDHNHRGGSYRRVLWAALAINATMFAVEVAAGQAAGSMSLKADALDFLGDAANYGISLAVLGMSLRRRASAALLKGLSMGVFGLWVCGETIVRVLQPDVPSASTMSVIGIAALLANLAVAAMLYAYREGDSNMRSVWLCTRNDAIGNVAVIAAAGAVWLTGTAWIDLAVAAAMATLAVIAAAKVIRQAIGEIGASPIPVR